jgi:hypothetical protein
MTATDVSASTITTIFGQAISSSITSAAFGTAHNWTADSSGLFHTSTNLAAEWQADYTTMLAGHGASLTAIQRLEGNAEAVFENTGLSKLGAAQQQVDREDVQRQLDAMGAAMNIDQKLYDVDPSKALTEQTYLQLEQTLQNNASLEELGMQGHGLNNSGISRYAGYTNDFQNNVDAATLFIGGGTLNNNGKAIADFFDDNILSHAPFAVVAHNGVLVQLNQNGDLENNLANAVVALDDSMYVRTYTSADFSTHAATSATNKANGAANYTKADQAALAAITAEENAPAPAGEVKTLFGFDIANAMTFNDGNGIVHTWTANAQGLFVTTTNLAAEWHAAYVDYVTTGGKDLTAEQKLEANAESVFENTSLSKLGAAQQATDRMDVQREFDAMFAAAKTAGINMNTTLTQADYLKLERTLQDNAALEQLAVEGHGLNNSGKAIYNGYTNDFQNNVDGSTLYVGPGYNHNQNALTDFFDDSIMSHVPFAVVVHNGKLVQLNQNAAEENTIATALAELNRSLQTSFYSQDFSTTKK